MENNILDQAEKSIGETPKKVWGFIKSHAIITVIALAALIAAWSLIVEVSKATTDIQNASTAIRDASDSTGEVPAIGKEVRFYNSLKDINTAREKKETKTPALNMVKGISVLSIAMLLTTLMLYASVSIPFLSRIVKGDDGTLDTADSANLLKFGAIAFTVISIVLTVFVGFGK